MRKDDQPGGELFWPIFFDKSLVSKKCFVLNGGLRKYCPNKKTKAWSKTHAGIEITVSISRQIILCCVHDHIFELAKSGTQEITLAGQMLNLKLMDSWPFALMKY